MTTAGDPERGRDLFLLVSHELQSALSEDSLADRITRRLPVSGPQFVLIHGLFYVLRLTCAHCIL